MTLWLSHHYSWVMIDPWWKESSGCSGVKLNLSWSICMGFDHFSLSSTRWFSSPRNITIMTHEQWWWTMVLLWNRWCVCVGLCTEKQHLWLWGLSSPAAQITPPASAALASNFDTPCFGLSRRCKKWSLSPELATIPGLGPGPHWIYPSQSGSSKSLAVGEPD